jgi:uncharacterized protein (TIGR02147 family)
MPVSLSKVREIAALCDITQHDDYRSYLSSVYEDVKTTVASYSYAHFSIVLGLSSTNVHAIISGHRKLSMKTGLRVAAALNLSESNKKYLLAMIRQEHARTNIEREQAFRDRLELAKSKLSDKTEEYRLLFFESWYNAAILELLRLENASDEPAWISENLRPHVNIPKIKQSLKLLQELGYLAYDQKRARLYPTEVMVSTGDQVERLAIISYHRQMIDLAVSAMDQIPAEDRDISAVTVAVSAELRSQFQEELICLRKRFLELASNEKKPNEILQINLQLFPVSRRQS